MNTSKEHENVHRIVKDIKNNDIGAGDELLLKFKPLLLSIAQKLNRRYGNLISTEDFYENAQRLALDLAVTEYDPIQAQLPHFLKVHVHAELVKWARPTLRYRSKATPINGWVDKLSDGRLPSDDMEREERENLILSINDFMWAEFDDRQTDVVLNNIMGSVTIEEMALKWGISERRVYHIKKECIEALREYLGDNDIFSGEDV